MRREFDLYEKLLLKWNQKINLTAITNPEEIRILHFEDSLAVIPYLPAEIVPRGTFYSGRDTALSPNPSSDNQLSNRLLRSAGPNESVPADTRSLLNVLDIGSGNGLPGLAIKIALPEIYLTIIETVKKKCDFMKEVVRQLGLKNVEVRHQFLKKEDVIGPFDVVVSRAAFDLSDLLKIATPQMKPGGLLVSWKSAGESLPILRGSKQFDRIPYELKVGEKLFSRELILYYS